MLGVIGKRFGDAGLRDVLIESGIVASGSVNGVMTGKHYNRATRIFRIVYEALHGLRLNAFTESLNQEDYSIMRNTVKTLENKATYPPQIAEALGDHNVNSLVQKYEEFCQSQSTPMFSFWSSFLDIMQVVLNFIRATRTGDFSLHLASIRSMLPWMFAYNRTNYMRYCTVYWRQMMSLPETHPLIYQRLCEGEFVVQRSKTNTFGQIACDMAIEQKCEELIHLTSGHVPEKDVSMDILNAKASGQEAFLTFVKERLLTDQIDFFAPMKMLKTKTFKTTFSKETISQQTLTKYKARWHGCLMEWLFCSSLHLVMLQTFGEFARQVLDILLSVTRTGKCKRIDFVTNRYLPLSIKSVERQKRSSSGEIRVRIVSSKQKKTMQWKKFLANETNKTELVEFLFEEWVKSDYASKLQGISLYFVHGEICHSSDGNMTTVQEVECLCSTQEEADTRMLLHAAHASKEYDVVIIRSADTDVAVLGVSHSNGIPAKLYLDIGTKNKRRLLDLGEIATSLGELRATSLLGFHAFTGCDTVSSFYGKGKSKSYALFQKHEESAATMSQLGSAQNVDDALLEACEKFVCKLYGSTVKSSVNELRYEIFRKTRANSRSLPPNKDSLSLHVKRANYQAFIWRHALQPKTNIDDPGSHGWKIEGGSLKIKWMKLLPAPKAILELMSCKCRKDCSTNACQCRKNTLHCTDACACDKCTNQREELECSDDDDDDDDYVDNDDSDEEEES
ncbi:uncharacterized protein [Apostichopus japonicus]|uniref:uncharacterized protein n=1 Tax=Stichopus japonicus TaxID=307972 RepID=UPI003AB276AF